MRSVLAMTVVLGATLGGVTAARAHCEIPCGIYGDALQFQLFREHIATVEKSMKEIVELQKQTHPDLNQLVRWVDNKDVHAQKIQDMVSRYFLTQRIELPTSSTERRYYLEQLERLHRLLITAMKMKQTTDLGQVKEARRLVKVFQTAYESH